jgi:hypothetical protein
VGHTEGAGDLKIKGAAIKAPRDWMRTAYGPEAYEAALSKLTGSERAFVDGPILAGSFYPIEVWDHFQAAMRAEALKRQGHNDLQFNMRNMREAGSVIIRGVYKFLLGMMSAQSTLEKCVIVFNRTYSDGRCELVSNNGGRAVVRYCDASPGLRTNLKNNFLPALMFVLELNGSKGIDGHVSRDEVVDGKLVYEVTIAYTV